MDADNRQQLTVVLAGLCGVIFGHVIKHVTTPESAREQAEFTSISMSSLVATPGLARIAGEVIGIGEDDAPAQAALAFITGATLTYFAEVIGRRLPGVMGGGDREALA